MPDTILIFVTTYSQYALDAFRLHVHGYILKPLTKDRVKEELEYALQQSRKVSPEDIDRKDQSARTEGQKADRKGEKQIKKQIKKVLRKALIRKSFWEWMPSMPSTVNT